MRDGDGLPEGWTRTTLGDVLPLTYGKGLVEAKRDGAGSVPVYGSSGMVGFHNESLTTHAALIVGRKGSVGAVHYSPVPCWPIDTTYYVEETAWRNLKFFSYLLRYLRLSQLDKSTAIPGLSRDDYNMVETALPPLAEQRRIVEAIEQQITRLDAGVAALKRTRAALKRYRAAVLKAAVEGKLTAAWRAEHPNVEPASDLLQRILAERHAKWEADMRAKGKDPANIRYIAPEAPDTANLPELPEGWCWATVEQLGEVQLGRQRAPQHHQGQYMRPYLRVANVFEDFIDTSDVLKMNFTPQEYEIYRLRYGDVLLNEGQSLELIGRPAMYKDEVPGACFQNTLVRFRAYLGMSPLYALIVYRAYLHSKRFQRIGKHTTNIAHLGAGRFAGVEFPVPPADEIEYIVAEVEQRLSIVSELEATVEANLKRADRLRQSILERAFAGKLVPQNPDDEPASVLLERIREQREMLSSNGRPANGRIAHQEMPVTTQAMLWDKE